MMKPLSSLPAAWCQHLAGAGACPEGATTAASPRVPWDWTLCGVGVRLGQAVPPFCKQNRPGKMGRRARKRAVRACCAAGRVWCQETEPPSRGALGPACLGERGRERALIAQRAREPLWPVIRWISGTMTQFPWVFGLLQAAPRWLPPSVLLSSPSPPLLPLLLVPSPPPLPHPARVGRVATSSGDTVLCCWCHQAPRFLLRCQHLGYFHCWPRRALAPFCPSLFSRDWEISVFKKTPLEPFLCLPRSSNLHCCIFLNVFIYGGGNLRGFPGLGSFGWPQQPASSCCSIQGGFGRRWIPAPTPGPARGTSFPGWGMLHGALTPLSPCLPAASSPRPGRTSTRTWTCAPCAPCASSGP